MTKAVTVEQLDLLLDRWHDAGAAVAKRLRPGVSRDELVRKVGDREIVLPEELLTWWGWRDGADANFSRGRLCFGIDEALARYDMRVRQGYPETELLPITNELPAILVECTAPSNTARVFTQYKGEEAEVLFESFGELVDAWIELMDRGRWVFDERGDPGIVGEVGVPPALEQLGLGQPRARAGVHGF